MSHFLNKVYDSLGFDKIPNSNTFSTKSTQKHYYFNKKVLYSTKIVKICLF